MPQPRALYGVSDSVCKRVFYDLAAATPPSLAQCMCATAQPKLRAR